MKSKQDWSAGQTVRVGFLSLIVKAKVATPGDFAPDAYILVNSAGTQLYKFVPHNGVEKISPLEARELLDQAHVAAEREAKKLLERSSQAVRNIAEINKIVFA